MKCIARGCEKTGSQRPVYTARVMSSLRSLQRRPYSLSSSPVSHSSTTRQTIFLPAHLLLRATCPCCSGESDSYTRSDSDTKIEAQWRLLHSCCIWNLTDKGAQESNSILLLSAVVTHSRLGLSPHFIDQNFYSGWQIAELTVSMGGSTHLNTKCVQYSDRIYQWEYSPKPDSMMVRKWATITYRPSRINCYLF